MNLSDEDDLFASDEEFMPKIVKENPIQDKFFTELHNVEERIDRSSNNANLIIFNIVIQF